MGIAKFIKDVKNTLGVDESDKSGKKKSMKKLLKKLNIKKDEIDKKLKGKLEKKVKKELQEELKIINIQIKKGDKILQKLNTK